MQSSDFWDFHSRNLIFHILVLPCYFHLSPPQYLLLAVKTMLCQQIMSKQLTKNASNLILEYDISPYAYLSLTILIIVLQLQVIPDSDHFSIVNASSDAWAKICQSLSTLFPEKLARLGQLCSSKKLKGAFGGIFKVVLLKRNKYCQHP